MGMATIRAHFDGRVLVPVEPLDLPTGKLLEIEVREVTELPPGSPALLLKMMHESPHVSRETIDELEQAIEEGKLPVQDKGVFDED